VLDDDAQDCPFCGAAMDGSAPAKKPAGEAKKPVAEEPKADTKAKPDNDDPFAVAKSPAGQKVLQCAPKPTKGRLHRVVCPMCDTQGFIPKGAVGRQVRCANRECLVPVFEAAGKEKETATRAPARVSDDTVARPRKSPKAQSEKNPLVMYGIVGAVLLALTLGLVAYLNQEPVSALPPINIPMTDFTGDEDGDPTELVASPDTPPVAGESRDYRAKATELVNSMVQEARKQNRDKPFCRRLTGDAYLRLGMSEEAAAEFAQMERISSSEGRDTGYYEVAPLMAAYWRQAAGGDQTQAGASLEKAKALSDKIPKSGAIAVEATIKLAAGMVHAGDVEGATALIESQQRDATVASQIDAVRQGVWAAMHTAVVDANRNPVPPMQVFAWNEPLKTAVALELAANDQWASANAWITPLKEPLTVADSLAAVAQQMSEAQLSGEAVTALVAAADARDAATGLRVRSVLSSAKGAAAWTQTKVVGQKFVVPVSSAPKGIRAMMDADAPDLAVMRHSADALADFAIAAANNGDDQAAADAMKKMYAALTSQLAPTVELRRASLELERDEVAVKERIADELALGSNGQQVRAKFINYRRGIDRQSRAAEERRLALLQMLGRVIQRAGVDVVKTALAAEGGELSQEVRVDDLSGLLFVAAAETQQAFPEILAAVPELSVPLPRVDPVEEARVIQPLVAAWQSFQKSGTMSAATILEQQSALPGLRAASAAWMAALGSHKADKAPVFLTSFTELKDDVWREDCLTIATRTLAERGMIDQIQPSLSEAARTPTQQVAALYGMLRGALDLSKDESVEK